MQKIPMGCFVTTPETLILAHKQVGTKRITGDTPDPGHRNNKAKLIDGRLSLSLLKIQKPNNNLS